MDCRARSSRTEGEAQRMGVVNELVERVLVRPGENIAPDQEILGREGLPDPEVNYVSDDIDWNKLDQSEGSKGYKLKHLVAFCHRRSLPAGGTKADLAKRLREWRLKQDVQPECDSESVERSDEDDRPAKKVKPSKLIVALESMRSEQKAAQGKQSVARRKEHARVILSQGKRSGDSKGNTHDYDDDYSYYYRY